MTCHSEVHKYVVGIEYDSPDEDKGFFDIRRTVSLKELAVEVADYLVNGKSSYPAFPPETNPEVWYAWDMDDPEDGDIYQDLLFEINKINDEKGKLHNEKQSYIQSASSSGKRP